MKKCEYCAKEISYFDQYCSDECEQECLRHFALNERFSKLFLVINTICIFGIPVGLFFAAFNPAVGIGLASLSCVVLGAMLIALPFPTEGMVRKHKLKKAKFMCRIFGIVVIGMGGLVFGLQFILK